MARCTRTQRCREAIRERVMPDSSLTGMANLLVMPNLDAANIAFNLVKACADGLPVGPMLLGMCKTRSRPGAECHRPRHREHDGTRLRGGWNAEAKPGKVSDLTEISASVVRS